LRADTLMVRLVREKPSDSILVKGHGPQYKILLHYGLCAGIREEGRIMRLSELALLGR
jgi:hypothetical protein